MPYSIIRWFVLSSAEAARLLEGGVSLEGGVISIRGAYLKLVANSSIYGTLKLCSHTQV